MIGEILSCFGIPAANQLDHDLLVFRACVLGTFLVLTKNAKIPRLEIINFLRENFGAGDRGRTGDVQLGKLAFYH